MNNKVRKLSIFIDKTLGELLFTIFNLFNYKKNNFSIDKNDIKNILIIRPGGIGDFLLTIPSFKKLRKIFPKANMTILLFKRNYYCIELYNKFDKVILIDKPLEFFRFLFNKSRYDLAIDFDQYRKIASILTLLSSAKIKIGFDNNGKGVSYDYPIKYSKDTYEVISFLSLLSPLTKTNSLNEIDLLLIKNYKDYYIKNKYKNIGIYASAMKVENRLPIKKWANIIEFMGENKNYYFFGSKNDKYRYDKLEQNFNGYNIIRNDGKLSLKESLNTLSKMDLLISEDGGVFHMGVCVGIPTTSYWLHGESNMNKWKAPFKKHKGILIKHE